MITGIYKTNLMHYVGLHIRRTAQTSLTHKETAMKKILPVLSLVLFSASSFADTYYCKTYLPPVHTDIARTTTYVTIVEGEKLKAGKKYDYSYAAHITIETRVDGYKKKNLVKEADVVANQEDVDYTINSRKEGISFWNFLDEMDQAGIKYRTEDGDTVEVRLTCDTQEQK